MDIKEIHNKLDKQCPADYKINEIILFAYPYRRVVVNATVNKSPEQSLQQIYTVLLQTIKAGFDTEEKIIEFLGLTDEDFILRELYFLRERGYADFVSGKWLVTDEGEKFIKDNSILKILEEDEFEFLIDAITDEAIEKEHKLYSNKQTENKLEPVIKYNIKEPDLLKGKHEQLSDIYKKINKGKAYLIDYDANKIKFDKKEYHDYYLVEYIPRLGKENDLEAYIEIRNDDKNFTLNKRLTKILMQKYPTILYEFTSSDRKAFAKLFEEEEINEIAEFEKTNQQIKSIPETKTLSIWETQAQFEEALKTVKKKILIESPWIKKATLKYIDLFEKALKKSVIIIILYGIEGNDEHDYQTMKKLKKLKSQYNNLQLIHLPTYFKYMNMHYYLSGTHRKLVIKDNDYYIQGSFNFLSFNKKEGQKVANEESILISKNVNKKWDDVFREYSLDKKMI